MEIIEIVIRIEEDRRAGNRYPLHATFPEIKRVCRMQDHDLMKEINCLEAEGKVRTGKTINSMYVESI